MEISTIRPSLTDGFATRAESKRPDLWGDVVGCWKPSLGVTGVKTLPDYSGNGFDFTLNNIVLNDWLMSREGYGLYLGGTNQDGSQADNGLLDLDSGDDQTISMILLPQTNTPSAELFEKNAGGNPMYQMFAHGTGDQSQWSYAIRETGGTLSDCVSGAANPRVAGQRAHLVGVRDHAADLLRIYLDGVQVGTSANVTGDCSNAGTLLLGSGNVGFFTGSVLLVVLWKARKLTPKQIWDHYKYPNAMFEPRSRIAYFMPAPVVVGPSWMTEHLDFGGVISWQYGQQDMGGIRTDWGQGGAGPAVDVRRHIIPAYMGNMN